jgi:hypothetical protein
MSCSKPRTQRSIVRTQRSIARTPCSYPGTQGPYSYSIFLSYSLSSLLDIDRGDDGEGNGCERLTLSK